MNLSEHLDEFSTYMTKTQDAIIIKTFNLTMQIVANQTLLFEYKITSTSLIYILLMSRLSVRIDE